MDMYLLSPNLLVCWFFLGITRDKVVVFVIGIVNVKYGSFVSIEAFGY